MLELSGMFEGVSLLDPSTFNTWTQTVVLAQAILSAGAEVSDCGWWVKERSLIWFDYFLLNGYEEDRWVKCLSMPKDIFMYLCSELAPFISRHDTRFRKVVPLQVKVGAVVYKLVTGLNFFNCSELFGIGESTAHEFLVEVLDSIIRHLGPKHLYWPSGQEMERISSGFDRRFGLVNCQGAIDGSHIRIRAPIGKELAIDYYNRKGFHSILLQTICDSDSVFLDVSTGYPESLNDKRILRLSSFYDMVQSSVVLQEPTVQLHNGLPLKPYILSDAGYSMAPWLMVPYSLTPNSS